MGYPRIYLGLCQFRRSVRGILSATFIGTLTAGISFYIIANDVNDVNDDYLYLCLFHGALAAIFGLIAFPNKAGVLLESQIMHKILPKAVSTGVNLTNQVIEKKALPLTVGILLLFTFVWHYYFWNHIHIINTSDRSR